ncbi:hypothetical protein G7009_13985 [Pseudomonas capeferrum]|uniref:hypothetical protein n=1 Tax=Pseudomonas capeferrum TaxID=1495066 RepID=UPI0015E34187|nr:hypothetical protein [Pseudomonas capeferrum]MBA1202850.1 hypothetical protein [Pseudomonas capeferrum]
MRALADFIMRGRVQATVVVVVSAVLPLLFWLSAAAGSLVFLRRGFKDASSVLVWGLLPALALWIFGEPSTLMVFVGTLALAASLRAGHSWSRVLLFSIPLGVVYGVVLGSVLREPLEMLAGALEKALPQIDGRPMIPSELITPLLISSSAASMQLISVLALVLARYWQAALYNPGGFGREFRELRLPAVPTLVLVSIMVLGPFFGSQFLTLAFASSVVLFLAGLALIHGLVAQGRLANFWLVGVYVTLIWPMQPTYLLLVVLAIVDSLVDFRGRRSPEKDDDNGSANGEG